LLVDIFIIPPLALALSVVLRLLSSLWLRCWNQIKFDMAHLRQLQGMKKENGKRIWLIQI